MLYFIFITKNTNANGILFSILCMSLILAGHFMSLKSNVLAKFLSTFVILAGLRSVGFKYLKKDHLKHSLL